MLCKGDKCHECAPFLHQVTTEVKAARFITLPDQDLEHFDGYIEMIEGDCCLFTHHAALMSSSPEKMISPEPLWYLDHHPNQDDQAVPKSGTLIGEGHITLAISHAKVIEQLLDKGHSCLSLVTFQLHL